MTCPGFEPQLFPGTPWDPEPSDAVPKTHGMIQSLECVLQRPTLLQAPCWALWPVEVPNQGREQLSSCPSMEPLESMGLPSRAQPTQPLSAVT